jgi:predicted nucleotidyltransferase
MEWLTSDLVYKKDDAFLKNMWKLASDYFSPITCTHHYLNMAKTNIRNYLQGKSISVKKYFYVLRPLLACIWIQRYQSMPPLLFQELAQELLPSGDLKKQIDKMIGRKRRGEHLETGPRMAIVHNFIEQKLPDIEAFLKDLPKNDRLPAAPLDRFFRETLREQWNN